MPGQSGDPNVRMWSGLAAEIMLATLPLLVITFVLLHLKRSSGLFASPEWSFGAAILFGQTLAKFVGGLVSSGKAAPGPVSLILVSMIVFGIVPSLLVLVVTLQATEEHLEVSYWIRSGQVVLFVAAAASYMILGAVSEKWSSED
jgi:hypothetical protein